MFCKIPDINIYSKNSGVIRQRDNGLIQDKLKDIKNQK